MVKEAKCTRGVVGPLPSAKCINLPPLKLAPRPVWLTWDLNQPPLSTPCLAKPGSGHPHGGGGGSSRTVVFGMFSDKESVPRGFSFGTAFRDQRVSFLFGHGFVPGPGRPNGDHVDLIILFQVRGRSNPLHTGAFLAVCNFVQTPKKNHLSDPMHRLFNLRNPAKRTHCAPRGLWAMR